MRIALLGCSLAALIASCTDNTTQTSTGTKPSDSLVADPRQGKSSLNQTTNADSLVTAYLDLKNALVTDDDGQAAAAGKQLSSTLQTLDTSRFSQDQKEAFNDVKEDMMEHSGHISQNAGNIAHQREHFDGLSRDMLDLVRQVKPATTLYHDHCPMYNGKKGAPWLSETKEIRNPYYGKKMLECGSIKEEIK